MKKLPFNPMKEWIKQRVKNNKNCIIVINGGTGSGKTYASIDFAIGLAEELGSSFTIKDNMDFNFGSLLDKMDMPQNNKPGTVFIFEEVGAMGGGSASREWQSRTNSFFQSFMQTSRHRNQILIMTTPMFSYLDKGARELVHMQITMKHINPQNKRSYGKPFLLQINPISGKTYNKYLVFRYGGAKAKLKELEFKLPPQDIIEEYEIIKKKYTDALNKKIKSELKPAEKTDATHWNKIKDRMNLAMLQEGLTQEERAVKLGCSQKTIDRHSPRIKNMPNKYINKDFFIRNKGSTDILQMPKAF